MRIAFLGAQIYRLQPQRRSGLQIRNAVADHPNVGLDDTRAQANGLFEQSCFRFPAWTAVVAPMKTDKGRRDFSSGGFSQAHDALMDALKILTGRFAFDG